MMRERATTICRLRPTVISPQRSGRCCVPPGITPAFPSAVGASWTTDAPFRETEEMIAVCRKQGILAVEMEAAALYALAQARQVEIICFAHVTNEVGHRRGTFQPFSVAPFPNCTGPFPSIQLSREHPS